MKGITTVINSVLLFLISVLGITLYMLNKNKQNVKKTEEYVVPIVVKKPIILTKEEQEGKEVYEENCSMCHKMFKKDGHFEDILERYPVDFIITFTRQEDSLLQIKDPVTVTINEEYNRNLAEHQYKELSADEIRNMLDYIRKVY
ncbi:c-type cytochrome [Aquimarina rhabdastrellae]